MVAPIMEVKNSGAEPPAAIHVASTRDTLMQDFVTFSTPGLQSLRKSSKVATSTCYNKFRAACYGAQPMISCQGTPATSGVKLQASQRTSMDPAK